MQLKQMSRGNRVMYNNYVLNNRSAVVLYKKYAGALTEQP